MIEAIYLLEHVENFRHQRSAHRSLGAALLWADNLTPAPGRQVIHEEWVTTPTTHSRDVFTSSNRVIHQAITLVQVLS